MSDPSVYVHFTAMVLYNLPLDLDRGMQSDFDDNT